MRSIGSRGSGPMTPRWHWPCCRCSPKDRPTPRRWVDAMVRWSESGPVDVGNQTRAVLGDAAGRGIGASEAAFAYQEQNPEAAGNGALMRTGPVALAHLGDRDAVAALAASVASLTHPHPASVEACVLWSLAIEQAVMTSSEDEVFDWRGDIDGWARSRRRRPSGAVAHPHRGGAWSRSGVVRAPQRLGDRRLRGRLRVDHLDAGAGALRCRRASGRRAAAGVPVGR